MLSFIKDWMAIKDSLRSLGFYESHILAKYFIIHLLFPNGLSEWVKENGFTFPID